jgi:hypothetical protein
LRRLGLATAAALLVLAAPAWAVSAPSVTTGRATGVGPTSATLNGTVNPNGSGTTYFFQYGRTTHYSAGTQATSAGSGTRVVHASAAIGGLAGNTTYHYRLVAFNSRGITRGSDRTFKTPPIPTVNQIAIGPNPVIFGNTFVVAGRLTGPPSVGGQRVQLEQNLFPYTGGFHQVGNTEITKSDGSYTFTLAGAALTAEYKVVEVGGAHADTPVVTESVALDVPSLKVRHFSGHRIGIRGIVHPGLAGAAVLVERELGHGRVHIVTRMRTVAVSPGNAVFSHRFRLHHTGVYRVVVLSNTGAYTTGATGPFIIRH